MKRASEINLIYFVKGCLEHREGETFVELAPQYPDGEIGWMDYLADRAAELQEVLDMFIEVPAWGVEAYELVEDLAVKAFYEWYQSGQAYSLKDRFLRVAMDWYEFDIVSYLEEQKQSENED